MEQNLKLGLKDGDGDGDALSEPAVYRRLIGRLLYLTITRPDILFAVNILSQFLQTPRKAHLDVALRILRYLKAYPGNGIPLSAASSLNLNAYMESDWAGCHITHRSTSGYCILLGQSPISWKTKKQQIVSRLYAEAEYKAMAQTACELQWLRFLLADLEVKFFLYSNNVLR